MRVTCKANKGASLPEKHFSSGYTPLSEFHVSIGQDYAVLGILLSQCNIKLLLADDNGIPNWHPVELFTVSDARVPEHWFFNVFGENEAGFQAIWGYEQLACDEAHNDALMERERSALSIFHKEKEKTNG